MLSFRQIASVVWTFLGFMVVAAFVLHVRYRPLEGSSAYLDTWTGKVHSSVVDARTPPLRTSSGRTVQIIELERLVRRQSSGGTCRSVRFAFPAPDVVEIR